MMRVIAAILCAALLSLSSPVVLMASDQPPKPQPQDEFVPIDQLPPEEQVPAGPMVVAAYVFVWVAFLTYAFTIVRRTKKVESDLAALERSRR